MFVSLNHDFTIGKSVSFSDVVRQILRRHNLCYYVSFFEIFYSCLIQFDVKSFLLGKSFHGVVVNTYLDLCLVKTKAYCWISQFLNNLNQISPFQWGFFWIGWEKKIVRHFGELTFRVRLLISVDWHLNKSNWLGERS